MPDSGIHKNSETASVMGMADTVLLFLFQRCEYVEDAFSDTNVRTADLHSAYVTWFEENYPSWPNKPTYKRFFYAMDKLNIFSRAKYNGVWHYLNLRLKDSSNSFAITYNHYTANEFMTPQERDFVLLKKLGIYGRISRVENGEAFLFDESDTLGWVKLDDLAVAFRPPPEREIVIKKTANCGPTAAIDIIRHRLSWSKDPDNRLNK